MNAQLLRGIQFLDIDGRQSVPHREVDGLASLLVQLLQIWQAQAPDIELADGSLSNRKTCNSEAMVAFSVAVQETRSDQVGQKTVNRAHWKPRQSCHLLGGESSRGFAEEMQELQHTLKSGDVVVPFWATVHDERENESDELSDENRFNATSFP